VPERACKAGGLLAEHTAADGSCTTSCYSQDGLGSVTSLTTLGGALDR
jgi:hypothetical protein